MAKLGKDSKIEISAPDLAVVKIPIVGTAPLVLNRFAQTTAEGMITNMAEGTTSRKRAKGEGRKARDFKAEGEGSMYRAPEGWYGFPANGFKAAMVQAGTLASVEMTLMRRVIYVVADGYDALEPTYQLVRIYGTPELFTMPTRTKGVANAASRGKFPAGWRAVLTIEFEPKLIPVDSVHNLVLRAGLNIGVGAGRRGSVSSVGMGWGSFDLDLSAATKAEPKSKVTKSTNGRAYS